MFKKILVALDDSDSSRRLFQEATTLAKNTHAQLMLLHVLTPFDEGYPAPVYPNVDGIYPSLHQQAMDNYMRQLEEFETHNLEWLGELSNQAIAAGVVTEFTQHLGNPNDSICSLARSWGADLIMMGRRGRSGLGELLLGSVSSYVMHHAHCSVLIVQGSDLAQQETPSAAATVADKETATVG